MPVHYLLNKDINKEKWDECIRHSPQGNIYALSWYLDAIDSNWDGVVDIRDGKYITVMPLPFRKRFGIKYIYQDPFVSELGVFSVLDNTTESYIEKIISSGFNRYRYIAKYTFNVSNACYLDNKNISKKARSYHLSLQDAYDQLYEKYSVNRKRDLKKAQRQGLTVESSEDINQLIRIFEQHTAAKIPGFELWQLEVLKRLYAAANKQKAATVYTVKDSQGKVLSSALFFFFQRYIIYYFVGNTPEGLQLGSSSFLINFIIHSYAGKNYILDFEGGDLPGLDRFYSSFGASDKYANNMYKNELSSIIKFLKKFNILLTRMGIR